MVVIKVFSHVRGAVTFAECKRAHTFLPPEGRKHANSDGRHIKYVFRKGAVCVAFFKHFGPLMQDASRATLLHRSEASAIVEDAVVRENRESSNVLRKWYCLCITMTP